MAQVSIGRAPQCTVRYQDTTISAVHCKIFIDALGAARVEDCSSNGTFVNDDKIGKGRTAALKNRDVISLLRGAGVSDAPPYALKAVRPERILAQVNQAKVPKHI